MVICKKCKREMDLEDVSPIQDDLCKDCFENYPEYEAWRY